MSMESWQDEFYPSPACRTSKKKAVEHSLRKWQGLTDAKLKKHGMTKMDGDATIIDDSGSYGFSVDASTCALCDHYWGDRGNTEIDCETCPLYKQLGDKACDSGPKSPWYVWKITGNPKPMIKALQATLRAQSPATTPATTKAKRSTSTHKKVPTHPARS